MTNEHVALLLETAAFFFVTLDLYGRKRLHRFQGRLERCGIVLRVRGSKLSLLVGSVLWIIFEIAIVVCATRLMRTLPWERLSLWTIGAIVLVGACAPVIGPGIVRILIAFAAALVSLATRTLEAVDLEGVMLVVGTVLFLCSRFILW